MISFFASLGVEDLLLGARGHPERVIPSLKPCARYLRNALSTFKPSVVLVAFKVTLKYEQYQLILPQLEVPELKCRENCLYLLNH